jgi:hypothetical protein
MRRFTCTSQKAKKPKSRTQAIEQFKPKTLLVLGDIFIFEENITIDIKYLKKSFLFEF